jgi:ribosomal protein L37AE/L43A
MITTTSVVTAGKRKANPSPPDAATSSDRPASFDHLQLPMVVSSDWVHDRWQFELSSWDPSRGATIILRSVDHVHEYYERTWAIGLRNLQWLHAIIHCPDARVQACQRNIERWKLIERQPLTSIYDIASRQRASIGRKYDEECLRVLQFGVERRVFMDRVQQCIDTWRQLPVEAKHNQDQQLNVFCKFWQRTDTIPELKIHRVCRKCSHPQSDSRREAIWVCKSCGYYEPYYSKRSKIHAASTVESGRASNTDVSRWRRFLVALQYLVQSPRITTWCTLLQRQLKLQREPLRRTPQRLSWTMILRAIRGQVAIPTQHLKMRLMIQLNYSEHPELVFLTIFEYNILLKRMLMIKYGCEMHHFSALCTPIRAFRELIHQLRWTHLYPLGEFLEMEHKKSMPHSKSVDMERWATMLRLSPYSHLT